MVVGSATGEGSVGSQGSGGHGSGSNIQLMDNGGVAVSSATLRRSGVGHGACSARISPGRGEIATRWLVLLMEALLGNQRGWIRYGGPEARSGAVA